MEKVYFSTLPLAVVLNSSANKRQLKHNESAQGSASAVFCLKAKTRTFKPSYPV